MKCVLIVNTGMHGRREGIVTKVAEVSVDAAMAVVEYFLQFMEWQ